MDGGKNMEDLLINILKERGTLIPPTLGFRLRKEKDCTPEENKKMIQEIRERNRKLEECRKASNNIMSK